MVKDFSLVVNEIGGVGPAFRKVGEGKGWRGLVKGKTLAMGEVKGSLKGGVLGNDGVMIKGGLRE